MAVVQLHPMFISVRGMIGDVVVKNYGTKTVITRKPVFRTRRFTEEQKANQQKFREASRFAGLLMADPGAKAKYASMAVLTGKPIMSLMIGDYMRSPSLDGVRARAGVCVTGNEPRQGNVV